MARSPLLDPPDGNIYPPGPGWLMVVVNDVPSEAVKVMVGDGSSPKVDKGALAKYALIAQFRDATSDFFAKFTLTD